MYTASRSRSIIVTLVLFFAVGLVSAQTPAPAKPIALPAVTQKLAQALVSAALKEKQHWSTELKSASPTYRLVGNFTPKDPAYPENQVGTVQAVWTKVMGGATIIEDYSMLIRASNDRKAWTLLPSDLQVTSSVLKEIPLPSKNVLLQTVLKAMRDSTSSLALLPEASSIVAVHLLDAYPVGIQALEQSYSFVRPAQGSWQFDYAVTLPLILDYEYLQSNTDGSWNLIRKSGQFALVLQRSASALSWSLSPLALVGLAGKVSEAPVNSVIWPAKVLDQVPNLAKDGLDMVWGRQSAYTSTFKVPD